MVKPARSSQRKSSASFSYLSYFCLIHFFNKDHTHTVILYYVRGASYFFLHAASKPQVVAITVSGPQFYTGRHCLVHHGFSWAGERPKPLVLVPLPAFPPCDFSFSPQCQQGCFRSQTPHSILLCLAGNCGFSCCRRRWLCRFLLPALVVYQPLHREEILKLTVGAAAVATSQSWLLGGIIQRKGEVHRGLPSCAIDTSPSWKQRGFSVFWEPQRIFLHLPTGGVIGQTLDWTIRQSSQPTNSRLSVQKTCGQLGKTNFKAV